MLRVRSGSHASGLQPSSQRSLLLGLIFWNVLYQKRPFDGVMESGEGLEGGARRLYDLKNEDYLAGKLKQDPPDVSRPPASSTPFPSGLC